MDDELLQIVLGEKLVETQEQSSAEGTSFWEGFIQRTAFHHLNSNKSFVRHILNKHRLLHP
jgi:hypothetical protein